MALANKTRFIAAATLIAAFSAAPALAQSGAQSSGPLQLAEEKMGKEIRVEEVLKGRKEGGSQTAGKPTQGGGGDGDEFGVERPAPEGRDPNEVIGGGDGVERALDGGANGDGSAGGKAAAKGGKPAAGKPKNTSGDNGDGDDLPPGDL